MRPETFKNRSMAACMKDALTFCLENKRQLFGKLWLWALLCSALFSMFFVIDRSVSYMYPLALRLAKWLFYIAALGCSLYYNALVMQFKYEGMLKQYVWKNIKLIGPYIVIALVYVVLITVIALILEFVLNLKVPEITLVLAVACLLAVLIFIPFTYAFIKYIVEDGIRVWSVFGRHYKTGFRHFGFLFGLLFFASIIIGIVYLIVFTPAIITMVSLSKAVMAVAMGDVGDVPTTIYLFFGVTCFIGYFIIILISPWMTYTLCNGYETIEAREMPEEDYTDNEISGKIPTNGDAELRNDYDING